MIIAALPTAVHWALVLHVYEPDTPHDAVIRVYDAAGNVIETHEHKGEFKEW